jgi:hypothetical protein
MALAIAGGVAVCDVAPQHAIVPENSLYLPETLQEMQQIQLRIWLVPQRAFPAATPLAVSSLDCCAEWLALGVDAAWLLLASAIGSLRPIASPKFCGHFFEAPRMRTGL